VRRLILIISSGFVALCFVSVTTLSATTETSGQNTVSNAETGSISQGTVTGASQSELEAVRRDTAQEERLPNYSQVVDDTSDVRFDAPGWKMGSTDDLAHGGSYASSGADGPGAGVARFKLKVPTSGNYALYAWWPSQAGNSTAARFGVTTASETRWTTVDQTKDGGLWVKLGAYDMKAGDGYAVRVSPADGSGRAVADAVALVRGVTSPPPDDLAPADGGQVSAGVTLKTDDVTYRASSRDGRVTGRQLIGWGRKHMGTPYSASPPGPCWAREEEDCSCFTHLVMRHFGKSLPDSPVLQFQYGHKVRSRSHLKRGDLVFWKESGPSSPITHVGMFAGNSIVLHASSYYGEVVESKMKYISGYYGARRIRPNPASASAKPTASATASASAAPSASATASASASASP
jgi:cell wall-associated NlpC family hydrolase